MVVTALGRYLQCGGGVTSPAKYKYVKQLQVFFALAIIQETHDK